MPFAVPAAFAANDASATSLAMVPAAKGALKFSGVVPSQVIKGCWQLGGGHRGDPASDRTSGASAVEDFKAFYEAGGGRDGAWREGLAGRLQPDPLSLILNPATMFP